MHLKVTKNHTTLGYHAGGAEYRSKRISRHKRGRDFKSLPIVAAWSCVRVETAGSVSQLRPLGPLVVFVIVRIDDMGLNDCGRLELIHI